MYPTLVSNKLILIVLSCTCSNSFSWLLSEYSKKLVKVSGK